MNIWQALDISPRMALVLAAAGLMLAGVLALLSLRRARRREEDVSLRLDDRGGG